MLYEFELGYNDEEATKKICCAKEKGVVDNSTITKWLKKFSLDRSGNIRWVWKHEFWDCAQSQ